MPGRDGTGPQGAGPMTGRGAGRCAGLNTPGYANPVAGRGFRGLGFGRGGGGRGRRNSFWATGLPGWMRFGWGVQNAPTASAGDTERSMLLGQAEILREQIDAIKNRLDALTSKPEAMRP